MSLSVAPSPIKVSEALLRTAGQFLHLINPPCERFVAIDDLAVRIYPGPHATIDDQIEMLRRAADFLAVGFTISPRAGHVTISVAGGWAEVHFVVQTTLKADDVPIGPEMNALLEQPTAVFA